MALTTPKTNTAAAEVEQDEQVMTEEGVQATAQQAEEPKTETKEVAERTEASAPAQTTVGGSQFEQNMAEDGFDGLTLGGLSFEQIRLPGEGQFLIGQEDEELGKEFDCVIQTTRSRYVVRQSDDQDAEMFYSYDPKGLTTTEGVSTEDTLQEWKEDGYDKLVIKKYIEALAIMIDEDGGRDRIMVMLSIPPASVQKFSGFVAQQQMMKKQLPNQYVTRCVVGKKVKNGNNSFFPWSFKNAGPAPELF